MDYCYSYDEECYHGQFNTPEEAVAEAFSNDPNRRSVWVGEAKHVTAHEFIDADDVLENAQLRADEHAGECAGDWLSGFGKEERSELEKLIGDWLQEKEPPCFWLIENPRQIFREEITAMPNGATLSASKKTEVA